MATTPFKTTLLTELRDLQLASLYLQEAFESGTQAEIEESIRLVMEANGWQQKNRLDLAEIVLFLRSHGIQLSLQRRAA